MATPVIVLYQWIRTIQKRFCPVHTHFALWRGWQFFLSQNFNLGEFHEKANESFRVFEEIP
jgi:hypothetical protein